MMRMPPASLPAVPGLPSRSAALACRLKMKLHSHRVVAGTACTRHNHSQITIIVIPNLQTHSQVTIGDRSTS
jgi:hypothetical protein